MTTSTLNFGWNGVSSPEKAADENDRLVKRINRVLKQIGQPPIRNIGGSTLEVLYDIEQNSNVSYIAEELIAASNDSTINDTTRRLVLELSTQDQCN